MSDSNVIEFPRKGHLEDAKHARLRNFFDTVRETAKNNAIDAYTVVALHAPDADSSKGCVHGDVLGLQDSIDLDWLHTTLGVMSETIDDLWHATHARVEQNVIDHAESDNQFKPD